MSVYNITRSDQSSAFSTLRAIKPGNRIDSVPKVVSIELAALNIRNIKYTQWDTSTMDLRASRSCRIHQKCLGHIQSNNGKRFSLPPNCINIEDPMEMSEMDKLNIDLMNDNGNQMQYAVSMRNLIAGKRGYLKYRCVGFIPATSMRGVATCHWSDNPRLVMLPIRWKDRIHVIYKNTNDTKKYVSPYYQLRTLQDGDRAILTRCPALTHNSTQCVIVSFWSNPSIGINPEMCDLLHLDYDGDEVHLAIIGDNEAIKEVDEYIEANPLTKFCKDKIQQSLSQISNHKDVDFMLPTTMSITESRNPIPATQLHKLSRCKSELWNIIEGGVYDRKKRWANFVTKSTNALHQLTEGHMRVYEGYIFGRQLKHVLVQTTSKNNAMITQWGIREYNTMRCVGIGLSEKGIPGAKLSSSIASKVQQAIMDKMKHNSGSNKNNMMLSLLNGESNFYITLNNQTGKYGLTTNINKLDRNTIVHCSASRSYIYDEPDTIMKFKKSMFLVRIACKLDSIVATDREIAEFAHFIMCLSLYKGVEVSAATQVNFLSQVPSKSLVSAVCDDIYSLDTRKVIPKYDICDVSSVIAALITGNYDNL